MNNVTYGNTTKHRPAKTKHTKTSSLPSMLRGARRANKINSNQIGFTEHGLVAWWTGYTQLWQCKYNLNLSLGGAGVRRFLSGKFWYFLSEVSSMVCYIVPTQYRNVTKTISKKGPLWTNNVVKIKLKYEIWTLEHKLKGITNYSDSEKAQK